MSCQVRVLSGTTVIEAFMLQNRVDELYSLLGKDNFAFQRFHFGRTFCSDLWGVALFRFFSQRGAAVFGKCGCVSLTMVDLLS